MRNKTRNILIMAICFIAVIGGLPVFAAGSSEDISGNTLWYKAADIVDASASVLPVEKTVVWEDLNPAGKVVSSEEVTVFYGEEKGYVISEMTGELLSGQELTMDLVGDTDVFTKLSSINDGLFWTPFDADVADADVKVVNTGKVETINGTECSVFEYTMYRDMVASSYNFEETVRDTDLLLADYVDADSSASARVTGFAWIDGNGVMRQLETNSECGDANYRETVVYEFDGSALYPVESILEGTLEITAGEMIAQTNFKATESMSDYWTATDYYR